MKLEKNKVYKYSRGSLYSVVIEVNKRGTLVFIDETFPPKTSRKDRLAFLDEANEAVLKVLDKEQIYAL